MLLNDEEIEIGLKLGWFEVTPQGAIGPASMDIQLGRELRRYHDGVTPIDPLAHLGERMTYRVPLNEGGHWVLEPGAFVLANTVQRVKLGRRIVARIEGKSTLGRLGLLVHATAGFIDPGFEGELTLEMTNINHRRIILRPGMWIAQLSFMKVNDVRRPYGSPGLGSHYQGQTGATPPEPLNL